jgi:hypothetical protein
MIHSFEKGDSSKMTQIPLPQKLEFKKKFGQKVQFSNKINDLASASPYRNKGLPQQHQRRKNGYHSKKKHLILGPQPVFHICEGTPPGSPVHISYSSQTAMPTPLTKGKGKENATSFESCGILGSKLHAESFSLGSRALFHRLSRPPFNPNKLTHVWKKKQDAISTQPLSSSSD